jgi:hypothetical protein
VARSGADRGALRAAGAEYKLVEFDAQRRRSLRRAERRPPSAIQQKTFDTTAPPPMLR